MLIIKCLFMRGDVYVCEREREGEEGGRIHLKGISTGSIRMIFGMGK